MEDVGHADAINELRSFGKWLRGKGRKYVGGEVDADKVCDALKFAVAHLSRRVGKDDFVALVGLAEEAVASRRRNLGVVADAHRSALRAGRKVVRFLISTKDGK